MSARDAARARWRADLLEYGAAALAGAGLDRQAEESTIAAAENRWYADLMDELAAAKAGDDPHVLREVKQKVRDYRKNRRESGPPALVSVNNFAEPSDDELIALGY